jgi:hypothetical protein
MASVVTSSSSRALWTPLGLITATIAARHVVFFSSLVVGQYSGKSGRQSIIATSTTEAEYVAMSLAAREAVTLRRLVSEVLQEQYPAIILYEDNQPAIYLLKKPPRADTRTKHMDVKYYFIRQEQGGHQPTQDWLVELDWTLLTIQSSVYKLVSNPIYWALD